MSRDALLFAGMVSLRSSIGSRDGLIDWDSTESIISSTSFSIKGIRLMVPVISAYSMDTSENVSMA